MLPHERALRIERSHVLRERQAVFIGPAFFRRKNIDLAVRAFHQEVAWGVVIEERLKMTLDGLVLGKKAFNVEERRAGASLECLLVNERDLARRCFRESATD